MMQNTIFVNNQERGGTDLLSIKHFHSGVYKTLRYFYQFKGTANITVAISSLSDSYSADSTSFTDESGSIDISSLTDGYYDITITADADIALKNIILTEEE